MADFDGESAYFGVYLTSPGAGLPPDALHLDVAAAHGCRILAQSTARL
jgi:predicted nucleic acid-binding protein